MGVVEALARICPPDELALIHEGMREFLSAASSGGPNPRAQLVSIAERLAPYERRYLPALNARESANLGCQTLVLFVPPKSRLAPLITAILDPTRLVALHAESESERVAPLLEEIEEYDIEVVPFAIAEGNVPSQGGRLVQRMRREGWLDKLVVYPQEAPPSLAVVLAGCAQQLGASMLYSEVESYHGIERPFSLRISTRPDMGRKKRPRGVGAPSSTGMAPPEPPRPAAVRKKPTLLEMVAQEAAEALEASSRANRQEESVSPFEPVSTAAPPPREAVRSNDPFADRHEGRAPLSPRPRRPVETEPEWPSARPGPEIPIEVMTQPPQPVQSSAEIPAFRPAPREPTPPPPPEPVATPQPVPRRSAERGASGDKDHHLAAAGLAEPRPRASRPVKTGVPAREMAQLLLDSFNDHNYPAALQLVRKLARSQEVMGQLWLQGDVALEFVQVYADWDRFRHSPVEDTPERKLHQRLLAVWQKMGPARGKLVADNEISRNVAFLRGLESSWREGGRVLGDPARALDCVAAGMRRRSRQHHDTAVHCFQRSIELAAIHLLYGKPFLLGDPREPDYAALVELVGTHNELSDLVSAVLRESDKRAKMPPKEAPLTLPVMMAILEAVGGVIREGPALAIGTRYRQVMNKPSEDDELTLAERLDRGLAPGATSPLDEKSSTAMEKAAREIVSRALGVDAFRKLLAAATHPKLTLPTI